MRTTTSLLGLLLVLSWPQRVVHAAELDQLTAANLPQFVASYEKELETLDSAYQDLERLEPALRDESGKLIPAESWKNRLAPLPVFKETARELLADPQDLPTAMRVFMQTESVTDDLAGLSETCFDNDQEEMGQRLNSLEDAFDQDKHLLESYILELAHELQHNVRQLERENKQLRSKVGQPADNPK